MTKQDCSDSVVLIIDPRGFISIDNKDVVSRNKKYARSLFESQPKRNTKLFSISGSSIELGQKSVTNSFSIYNISKPTLNIIKFAFLSALLIKKMKWKVELLVAGDPWESYWSAYFLNKFLNKKIPIQTQVHGDIADPRWRRINYRNRIRFSLAKLTLPKASSVRAVTKYQAENLVKAFGIKREKIVVVPVPINILGKAATLKLERPKTIGLIGRIHQDRGIWEFIKLVRVLSSSAKDFKVVVVGDGPSKDKFLLKLSSVISKNRIIYLGQLPESELRNAWKKIGVLVSMAPVESYGRVMRESLIAGVPVWATKSAGVKDLMDNCKKGEVKILDLGKSDVSLDKDFNSLLKTKVSSDFSKRFIKENNTYAAKLAKSWINTINKSK
jgi:glycosyltransferase involved in cell wall biosynthesis